jgi:hypothetical protein
MTTAPKPTTGSNGQFDFGPGDIRKWTLPKPPNQTSHAADSKSGALVLTSRTACTPSSTSTENEICKREPPTTKKTTDAAGTPTVAGDIQNKSGNLFSTSRTNTRNGKWI